MINIARSFVLYHNPKGWVETDITRWAKSAFCFYRSSRLTRNTSYMSGGVQ